MSETDGEINLDSLPHICQCPSFHYQMEMEAEKLLCKWEVRVCCGWKHVDANRQTIQQHHALVRSEKLQVNRLVWHEGMLTGSRLFPWWCFGFVLRSWLISPLHSLRWSPSRTSDALLLRSLCRPHDWITGRLNDLIWLKRHNLTDFQNVLTSHKKICGSDRPTLVCRALIQYGVQMLNQGILSRSSNSVPIKALLFQTPFTLSKYELHFQGWQSSA